MHEFPKLLYPTAEEHYRQDFKLFAPEKDSVFEIRAVGSYTLSGYFRDKDNCLKWLMSDPSQCWYITMNPVIPDVYAREQREQILSSRYSAWAKRFTTVKNRMCTTQDNEISRLRWILIDYDSAKPSGVSSTDAEKYASYLRCLDGLDYLRNTLKLPMPVICDSGNGYHQLFAIDRPVQDKDDIANFLNHVSDKLSDNIVKIDVAVGNPSRITKCYGTMTDKGNDFRNVDGIEDRPHRQSGFIFIPEEIEVMS